MKAIISDIHSNLEALQAVLADIAAQKITEIYCLGDIIGYGPNPRECIDLAMQCQMVLLGNHDQGAMFDPDGFNPPAERAIFWTRQQLEASAENRVKREKRWEFLADRPRTFLENGHLFVHGSARNPLNEYVFPEDIYNQRKMDRIFALIERYCFQGHTHVPGVFTESLQDDSYLFQSPEELADSTHKLDERKTMINVGSVGQPRDGNWRACYVLLDGKNLTFRRIEYDIDTTIRKIHDIPDLDNFLGDRLRDGRELPWCRRLACTCESVQASRPHHGAWLMAQETLGDDILFAPIRDLADRLRTRRLSPVALTEAYLDRLQKIGPRLNAVVTLMRESALKEARAADEQIRAGKYRGLLHGIPYGAKDLLATNGVPTTWGAEPFRKQVFDYDATVIRKLRDAGAILLGKLAMVELAGSFGYNNADASFSGPCKTPWNLDYWSGGSSSGSGACVAAGLCAFAIGSETSGSIITPAAYCGVAGLRPTFGRVSRYGAMALSWTLDKLGPLCRSADCCGIVLGVMAGRDAKDLSTVTKPYAWPENRPDPKAKFRVGVIGGSTTGIQPAVRDNFRESVKVLSRFCDITEDVPFPDMPFGPVVSVVINAEGANSFRELIESERINDLRTAQMKTSSVAASMTLAVDYLQALRTRTHMKKTMDELYAKYDALIAPARTTVSYPINRNFSESYPNFRGGPPIIPAGNVVGQPAIAIPNGFGPNGLPTGIQFTGRVWSEVRLLSIAHAYQQATDWHRRRPKI